MLLSNLFAPMPGEPESVSNPLFFVFTIASIVVSIFTTIALIKAISEPDATTFKSSYQFAKAGAWQYVVLSLMVGVVVMLGFVLLIIPGIIAMTWFGFSYYTMLFDNKRGVEAMKASKQLVDGRFMPVFIRYVVLFLAMIVVVAFVTMIGSIFNEPFIENLLMVAAYCVLVPVSLAYMYLLYQDVKREGVYRPTPEAVPAAAASIDAATNTSSSTEPLASDTVDIEENRS